MIGKLAVGLAMMAIIMGMMVSASFAADTAYATDRRAHPGRFIVDPPTLICLGFAWEITGDDNRNASATVEYRQKGETAWRQAQPMLRSGGQHVGRAVDWLDYTLPNMLAGSIIDLKEDTQYEVRVTLHDPDGVVGEAVKTVTVRTRAAPRDPAGGHVYHLYPPGSKQADSTKNKCVNLNRAYYGGIANLGDFNIVREPGQTRRHDPGPRRGVQGKPMQLRQHRRLDTRRHLLADGQGDPRETDCHQGRGRR